MEYYNIRIRPDYIDLFTGTIAVYNDGTFTGFATESNYDNMYFIKGTMSYGEINISLISTENDSKDILNYKVSEDLSDSFIKKTIGNAKYYYGDDDTYKCPVRIELVNIEDLKIYLVENKNYSLTKKIK